MGTCVCYAIALDGDFTNANAQHWQAAAEKIFGDAIELEFGAWDGSYSRGFASRQGVTAAIRKDFLSYVAPNHKDKVSGSLTPKLQISPDPKRTFEFEPLCEIFITQIAPLQVLIREDAIFYSPARLKSLGLP